MPEQLAFNNPKVQELLAGISREILMGDLIRGVGKYADFRRKVTVDSPITTEYIHSALGAETLFAVWRLPIDSTYDNILHIVKVDMDGGIIPGSETMVGAVYKDKVVHCASEFTDTGVHQVEAFAQRQERLPWQPNADTGLYTLAG